MTGMDRPRQVSLTHDADHGWGIVIDGTDIAASVAGFTLAASAAGGTTLTLELSPASGPGLDIGVDVAAIVSTAANDDVTIDDIADAVTQIPAEAIEAVFFGPGSLTRSPAVDVLELVADLIRAMR